MKYYSEPNAELCYPLDYFKEKLSDDNLAIELQLMESMSVSDSNGMAWCQEISELVEPGCNVGCAEYSPKNKISGCCEYYKRTLQGSGRFYLLTNKGLKKVNRYD